MLYRETRGRSPKRHIHVGSNEVTSIQNRVRDWLCRWPGFLYTPTLNFQLHIRLEILSSWSTISFLNTVSQEVRRGLWQYFFCRVLIFSDNCRAFGRSGVSATITRQSLSTPTIHLTLRPCCLLLPITHPHTHHTHITPTPTTHTQTQTHTHTIPNRKPSQHLRSASPTRWTRRLIVDTQTGIKLCPTFWARNQNRRHSTSGGNPLLPNHTEYQGSTQRLTLLSWQWTWILYIYIYIWKFSSYRVVNIASGYTNTANRALGDAVHTLHRGVL